MLAFAGTLCNHDLPPHLLASRVCPLSMLYLPYGAGAWIGRQKVVGLAITTIKAGSIITVAFLSCDRSAKLGGRSIAVGSGHCSLLHYVRKRYLASNYAIGCSRSHHVRLNLSPRTPNGPPRFPNAGCCVEPGTTYRRTKLRRLVPEYLFFGKKFT